MPAAAAALRVSLSRTDFPSRGGPVSFDVEGLGMHGSDFRIRRATRNDASFILGLASRFAETRAPWRDEGEVTDGTVRALKKALQSGSDEEMLLVAEDPEQNCAGFVYVVAATDFFTNERVAHVSEIAVERDGTGAGLALMRAAEEWAAGRGARYVSLHVNARNERARAFYERLGYDLEWHRLNKRLR
jgi:ribosomal protein S18 acetylase RimI-like enzyme